MKQMQILFSVFILMVIAGCTSETTPSPETQEAEITMDLSVVSRTLNPESVEVKQGDEVTLRVTTDEPGDFHITGYEIEQEMNVDNVTEITFTADTAGRFNLELHPVMENMEHMAEEKHIEEADHKSAHQHGVRNVDAEAAPTLSVVVSKDPKEGYNLELETSNIEFVPQEPGIEHVDGQGHAHVYIDGTKIGRFYEKHIYLGKLAPGKREVRVTLSDNTHNEYAVDGETIAEMVTLEVPESEDMPHHTEHEIRNVTAAEAPTLAVSVTDDPAAGWNLILETTNFEYAPKAVGVRDVLGEGHAHIYIDGAILTRLYGPTYHLGSLSEGEHEIRIVLSDNLHNEYAVEGERIEFMFTLEGQPGGKDPYSAYGIGSESHDAEHTKDTHNMEKTDEDGHAHDGSEEDIVLGSLIVNP